MPNRYVVELGRTDHDRLAPWETQLTNTLAEMVQEHVDDEGWSTFGDIEVSLSRNEELGTGMFTVSSSVDPNAGPPPPAVQLAVHAGGPGRRRRTRAGRRRPRRSRLRRWLRRWLRDPGYGQPEPAYGAGSYGEQHNGYANGYAPPATVPPPAYQQQPAAPPAHRRRQPAVAGAAGRQQRHRPRQDADLRLPDTGVCRQHVDVRFDGTGAVLHDLGSTNGTTVNGHRAQSWQLADGDVIRLGHTVLVYRQEPA